MRTEEILKSQTPEAVRGRGESPAEALERAEKRSKEELKRAKEAINLWNDIARKEKE